MKLLLLSAICLSFFFEGICQIPEVEPNNTFATANPIARYEIKSATITTADQYDYFRAIIPEDGSLKILVQATCTGASGNGWLYLAGFDRRKTSASFVRYISGSTVVPVGSTVFDTVTLHGMAADTFYFRFETNKSFNYQFSYVLENVSTNDIEPNETFATGLPINQSTTKVGHINYYANGGTYDAFDYYRTALPADGALKIYVEGTNRSGGSAWLYLTGYDRRKTSGSIARYISGSTTIPANTTIYDTITLNGMAADSFHFRFQSSNAFSYKFRYEMVDGSTNDAEPNGTFATALPINLGETKQGHTNYYANGSTYDNDDYYRTIIPTDGTMKIYVQATNRSGSSSWLYLAGYDRRKTSGSFGNYISGSTNIAHGTTIYDTITLYGRAADTFYFRFYAASAFSYQFRYEVVEQSPNDVEPNNSFSTASSITLGQTAQGHTNYVANGSTLDPDDYYLTLLPYDGTLKVYVEGTNRSGALAWLYMAAYDRRKTSSVFAKYISNSTNIPAGTTIKDTITLFGRAADSTYFRLYSSGPFTYKLRYDLVDTSTNDVEPNNSFATALPLSGTQVRQGHIEYAYNGITDTDDYYRTDFASNDSLKLYLQATNNSGITGDFYFYGYNAAFSQIYTRHKSSVPAGATVFDSVKIAVTAPQTIYQRVGTNNRAFNYQLSLNSKLPGNGFSISGKATACIGLQQVYKSLNVALSDAGVTYHWTISSGGNISFVDSIATVTWTTAGNKTISLFIANANGSSVTKTLAITVSAGSPPAAPIVNIKGRYLDIAALPSGATRQWFKNGLLVVSGDSVFYAADAGSYTATYINECGESPASSAINFNAGQLQTISWGTISDMPFSLDSFRIMNAVAISGLPASYKMISGPGVISNDTLRPTGFGAVVVQALQFGGTNWAQAIPVNKTINVVKGSQSINFLPIANKIYNPTSPTFALDANASSGLNVTYQIVSGPATVSGYVLRMTGIGTVQVKAMQTGNANYNAAPEVTQSFCIGIRNIELIKGPSTVCVGTLRFTTKKITGVIYEWSLSGGGVLTQQGDTATVQWQSGGAHTLSVKGYSACDTVRSTAQTFTVFVDTSYNVTAVTSMTPPNGETGLALPVSLQWSPSQKATSYDVYVWPATGTEPVFASDSGLTQTSYELNNNIALNQPYNWKVVARNVCSSAPGATQQFTVAQNSSSKPDLVMDTIALPATIYQGQPISVTWRVKNIGQNGTGIASWKDRIYLFPSNDIRVGGAILLGEYNNPSFLFPGEIYTQTKTVTIPPGTSGNWYISVITDNQEAFCFTSDCNIFWGPRGNQRINNVQESNEFNNYRQALVPILDGALPDLKVKSIGVPVSVFGGSVITATYTVKNEGVVSAAGKKQGACPQRGWTDRFFISKEPAFNITKAKELISKQIVFYKPGTSNCSDEASPYVDFLLPDSSYTLQHELLIPYDYFGTQYIYVYTNGYNEAFEGAFSTNNIRRTDSINVTIAPPSDLVVSSIQTIPNKLSGDELLIGWIVTNQGANPPQESGWTDSVFLCNAPVFSQSAVIVKSAANSKRPASFNQGAFYNRAIKVNIPGNTPSGSFYVFVKTDANGEVFEFDQENNNTTRSNAFTITLQDPIDLVVTSISVPDSVREDLPFNISYNLKNNGTRSLTETWDDAIYASDDTVMSNYGRGVIGTRHSGDTLLPGATKTYTSQLLIQKGFSYGNKNAYIKVFADSRNFIYEHNAEGNNSLLSLPFWVKPNYDTIVRNADLKIQSFTAPATANANTSINVSWAAKNGGSQATSKTSWYDRIYLSQDSIATQFDYLLSAKTISDYKTTGLLPDSGYSRTATLQIPLKTYGNWFLILRADYISNIENDSASNNNELILPLQIIAAPVPDLVITPQSVLPDSIWGGQQFFVKYSVQNNGPVAMPAGTIWYDRVYISNSAIPEGYGIASNQNARSLNIGESFTDSLLVKVPSYFSGAKYLILGTDSRNDIFEGQFGEGNNHHARPINVLDYYTRPAPDLIVSKVTVPDSAIVGKNITAGFTIKNIGLHPAIGTIANALYLSSNSVFESNLDKLIASNDNTLYNIPPGDSVASQLTGKAIPNVTGLYRGLVRTNVRNTVHEFPFANNNNKASDSLTFIDARALALNITLADTLIPKEGNYYKVTVPADVDLSIALNTNLVATGSNSLHVAYNRVPSDLNFDISGYNPASLNQQALVSSTQAGTYYIKAQSQGVEVTEPVSLTVTALPFSIISTIPAAMGKGAVSGKMYGAGFKPNTVISLRNGSNNYNVAAISKFVNSTILELDWNLESVPLGVYDVVATNPGNIETILAAAVTVQTSSGINLEYTPLLPSVVRPFGGVYTYKGKNIGNVNIPVLQGDVTMSTENATIYSVSTTGKVKRYTQYAMQYDSLMTEDWYTSNKTTVVPFFGRNIAPGEEFTVTIEVRFNRASVQDQNNKFPLQCRIIGYSGSDLAKEQIRNFEMGRRMILYTPKVTAAVLGSELYTTAQAGSRPFIERIMKEFVDGGILFWRDTVGLNLRWDCSRCLQNLPEARPSSLIDSFAFSPGGDFFSGKQTVSSATLEGGKTMLLDMTASHYWPNYSGGTPGRAGEEIGWDLLKVEGPLNITATTSNPFTIQVSALWRNPANSNISFGKPSGWSPVADTSFLIISANSITGFDSTKFRLVLNNFATTAPMRGGRFVLRLRNGSGGNPDSIMLAFVAYKPQGGEVGVEGVGGNPGEPGSPGGRGGDGTAQQPNGGKGGRGGRGGEGFYIYPTSYPPGLGGNGGRGGLPFGNGNGGDGGDGNEGGSTASTHDAGAKGGNGNCGENGGLSGGKGGKGGKGGDGGKGGPEAAGGLGGNGGCGGNSNNSAAGGGGGNAGDGGPGGSGCKSGKGKEGGNGGLGGGGPLGAGSDGIDGKKGSDGSALDCGCGGILPGGDGLDNEKIINGAIGYAKATAVALSEIPDKGIGATMGQITEHMDQGTAESSPGMANLAVGFGFFVDVAGAAGQAVGTSATVTWSACCKSFVAGLKIGDNINKARFGSSTYPGSTYITDAIKYVTAVSSVPDLLAELAKFGLSGSGNSVSTMVLPCDPNEIKGPDGYGLEKMVSAKETMPYIIHFENDSLLAEVAAQRVIVRQKLSNKVNPLTFRVGSFNFGGNTFTVPSDKANYFTTINLDSLGYHVNVTAGVDILNREAFWVFQTIDPTTGLVPANPFTGLLPVNDFTGKGTGFVNYSIKPIASAQTGDSIAAKASIIFDQNDPIETNTWVNIVDAVAPTSSLSGLPVSTGQVYVPVVYSGTDDNGGSGINHVDLYIAVNNATPVLWVQSFSGIDTIFLGEKGKTYTFYALATDNVGNKEILKNVGSVTIRDQACIGNDFSFTSNISGSSYQWQVNSGSGFVNLTEGGGYTGVTSATLVISNAQGNLAGSKYRALVNGSNNSLEFTVKFVSVWDGTVSTAWDVAANWSCGVVPNEHTDVVLEADKPRYPVVANNATVRSASILSGASITVNSGVVLSVLK